MNWKLPAKTKTVIVVDMPGYQGLGHFIQSCYDLEEKWYTEMLLGNYDLFEMTKDHGCDLEYAMQVILANRGDSLYDVRCVLAKLCEDGYLPYGNYLINW